jgi:hypothetical protein
MFYSPLSHGFTASKANDFSLDFFKWAKLNLFCPLSPYCMSFLGKLQWAPYFRVGFARPKNVAFLDEIFTHVSI